MTIIESEQSREVRLTEITRGPFVLRFLSYRKSEDAALNLRSEDYIVSEIAAEKAIFGLCDGVGSSFYGNIGSQILGEILLSWLERVPLPNNFSLEKPQVVQSWLGTLTSELTSELNNKVAFATSIIQKKEITSQDELVRIAETTQRDDFGTQSNFACGIVWARSRALPKGLVLLFWLGNARIRLFNQSRDLTSVLGWGKDPNQLTEVWSSKDGVIGKVYSHVTDLTTVTHIIAYSDGLENAERSIRPDLDGAQLEALVQESQSIKDDDATFLELSTRREETAGIADDIVVPLRKQLRPAASGSSQPAPAEPEVQRLRSTLAALQKKYDAQSKEANRSRLLLIAVASLLAMLCFCSGLFIRPVVGPIIWPPSPTPTATQTLIPTATATQTFTSTPSPSATFTETSTSTATASATPSQTDTPMPSATVTPSPTPTPSMTSGS
jgi:hypothetical protein